MCEPTVLCFFGLNPTEIEEDPCYLGKTLIFFTEALLTEHHTVYYEGDYCDVEAFAILCQARPFEQFSYKIAPKFSLEQVQKAEIWIKYCQEIQWHCFLLASEKKDFGICVYRNIKQNLLQNVDTSSFAEMKNIFLGIPAFICGAGPSLALDVELLRNCDRGLVFAGGAALGFLTKKGIAVHVAAGVDPNPNFERVQMHGSFHAPFFFQNRFSASCLAAVKGPLFRVPSNQGSVMESWIEGQEPFNGGWTVTTFCYALARYFGCSPIVLVGVDLSYPPTSAPYAEGIQTNVKEDPIVFEDRDLGHLHTKKDWVIAARWIESQIGQTPVYSTSASGLSLQGVQRKALKGLLQKELVKFYEIEPLVERIRALWTDGAALDTIVALDKSLVQCLEFVDRLLQAFEKNYPVDPREKGLFIVELLDLQEEIFYKSALEPLWALWKGSILKAITDPYSSDLNQLLFFKQVLKEYRSC